MSLAKTAAENIEMGPQVYFASNFDEESELQEKQAFLQAIKQRLGMKADPYKAGTEGKSPLAFKAKSKAEWNQMKQGRVDAASLERAKEFAANKSKEVAEAKRQEAGRKTVAAIRGATGKLKSTAGKAVSTAREAANYVGRISGVRKM